MNNEWEWHGEEDDEKARTKENREKNSSSKRFIEKEFEDDRALEKDRGQEPQEIYRSEGSSGEFCSPSGDQFRLAPARHLLCRSESSALTRQLGSSNAKNHFGDVEADLTLGDIDAASCWSPSASA